MMPRNWVVEGKVEGGWIPVQGHIYTDYRAARSALRIIRIDYEAMGKYPKNTFRLAEYVRKATA